MKSRTCSSPSVFRLSGRSFTRATKNRFYIIIRGKLAVSATDKEGQLYRISTLDDGDYFGEISLLTERPATATVETLTQSIFLILQREQLEKLMRQHPELDVQVQQALQRRLKETDSRTA